MNAWGWAHFARHAGSRLRRRAARRLRLTALIVDLDNTLFPATAVPREILRPVMDRMREANQGGGAVDERALNRALVESWHRAFDVVADEFSLPVALREVWRREMAAVRLVDPVAPYPDVWALAELDVPKFLVTTGYRVFQESKIDALGIRPLFDEVYIDALGEPERVGKERIFGELLPRIGGSAAQAAVIGDSAESEITVGNKLGMSTVQVLRDGVERAESADYHVSTLWELCDVFGY